MLSGIPASATRLFATVTLTVAESTQPEAVVPVTVYVVDAGGLTSTCEPFGKINEMPVIGLQVYVLAPVIEIVSLEFGQTVVAVSERTSAGILFTVTVTFELAMQPAAEVAVTLYVVVVNGDAETESCEVDKYCIPVFGIQLYEFVEGPASMVTEYPEQIDGFGGEKTITGGGLTVTVTVCVAGHNPEVDTV